MKLLALILLAISSVRCAPAKVNPSAELHNDAQITLDIGRRDYDNPVDLHLKDDVEEEHKDDVEEEHKDDVEEEHQDDIDQANPYIESLVNSITIEQNLSEKPLKIGGLSVSGNLSGGRILFESHIVIGPGGPNATSIDSRVLIEGEYDESEDAEKVAESITDMDYERKLQQLFSSMDLNEDGFLATSELLLACHQNGVHLQEAKAELMLDTAGFDYAQFHRVLEFAPSVITKDLLYFWIHATRAAQATNDLDESYPHYTREYKERLRSVFLSLDKNRDGELIASELVTAFRDMGGEIEEDDAHNLLGNREDFDVVVDFDEWKELLHQLPSNSKAKGSIHYWREAFAFYGGRWERNGDLK